MSKKDATATATSDQQTAEQTEAQAAAVANGALQTIGQGIIAAQRAHDEAAEKESRKRVIAGVRAANKRKQIYTNPEIKILCDCKIAGHTVYKDDEVGENAGITQRDFKKLTDLKMAEYL